MLPTLRQDLTFAVRQFRRSPAFTLTVILTLALGIGATTAIFSLVDAILLRPLPFPESDRLVAITTLQFPPGVPPTNLAAADYLPSSYPDFFDWRRENRGFASLASYDYQTRLFSKADGENAQVIRCGRVSANLFSTLGVVPVLGRTFTAEEDQPGHRVVILSHELWVSTFASSPDASGQTVMISHLPYTVVGVMPAGFHYATSEPGLFWSTFAIDAEGPGPPLTSFRDEDRLGIVGRLKPGVSIDQALADLNTIQRGLAQQYSEDRYRPAVFIQPLLNEAISDIRPLLTLLLASVGVVLLIGCANVAGLLLARAAARRSEIAVRTALGASRFRVVRQLLIEALLLALAGGAVGILLSFLLLRVGLRWVPSDIPRLYNVSINAGVLAFAVLLSAATALIFGLLPAWKMSRSDPAHTLRDCGATMTSGRRRNRLHHALVVVETALGFCLLIGSGLLIKSLMNMLHLEPGFDTSKTVFFDIALSHTRYPDPSKIPFFEKVLPEFAAIPGVERVAAGHPLPSVGSRHSWTSFTITGHVSSPDNLPAAEAAVVTPGFFETLSIPLMRGRTFTPHDNVATAAPVAIVNRSLVANYFPNEDPIGRFFTPHPDHTTEPLVTRQIIGIVGNTRGGDPWDAYQPRYYIPYAQDPTHQRPVVVMKVAGDPLSYENTVHKIVDRSDKLAPVFGYHTFAENMLLEAAQPRFEAALVSVFAAIALLLSALGLYAVLSYVVAERMRELGLRMAFGASRSNILGMVVQRALLLGVTGIVAGGTASILAGRLVNDLLFRVQPMDPWTYTVVALVLLIVSVVAALAPALRAAYVNPLQTLREN
jgi:putative ABC transport system permease protein